MKRRILSIVTSFALSLSFNTRAEDTLSYPAMVWDDVTHTLSAPTRWEKDEWQTAGWTSLAVLGTVAVIDKPVRDYMVKQDQNNKTWLQVEKFGREYAVGITGAFFVAGLVGDETSMHVAQDVVAASLISSGIIGVATKTVVGRSRPLQNKGTTDFAPFTDMNSSFFSGHATQAFTLAAVIAETYNETWIDVTAYGLASLAAVARTYHDKHFTSDILTGAIVGTLVGKSVVAHNKDLRGNKLSVTPAISQNMVGIQIAGRF
ncbi:MAG: phosphatase PAP2 family protein [Gallionella sp.]|nr:phosphatase PAP2 family protein [Gallionella sp.]